MSSSSSRANRFETSPLARTLFMYSVDRRQQSRYIWTCSVRASTGYNHTQKVQIGTRSFSHQTFHLQFHYTDKTVRTDQSLGCCLVLHTTGSEMIFCFLLLKWCSPNIKVRQPLFSALPRKASSLMSLSVKRNVTPFPCWPAIRYSAFRSSSRLLLLYDLKETRTHNQRNYFPSTVITALISRDIKENLFVHHNHISTQQNM